MSRKNKKYSCSALFLYDNIDRLVPQEQDFKLPSQTSLPTKLFQQPWLVPQEQGYWLFLNHFLLTTPISKHSDNFIAKVGDNELLDFNSLLRIAR